jgi:hypothetical protein
MRNHSPVQVRNSDDLSAHVVVEAVQGVRVDEAVSHPEAGANAFLDFAKHL